MINDIITHDGAFHADEVFAVAVLKKLYPSATVVRDRTYNTARLNPGVVVLDMGGRIQVDVASAILDHHQPAGAGSRTLDKDNPGDVQPYATFGLLWNKTQFGWLYVNAVIPPDRDPATVRADVIPEIVRRVDAWLVAPVDYIDCKGPPAITLAPEFSLNKLISVMNASDLIDSSQFQDAVELAGNILRQMTMGAYRQVMQDAEIARLMSESPWPGVVFPMPPSEEYMKQAHDGKSPVIVPAKFTAQDARQYKGYNTNSFLTWAIRQLPSDFIELTRGYDRRTFSIEQRTQIAGQVGKIYKLTDAQWGAIRFVHNNGFMMVVDGLEEAMQILRVLHPTFSNATTERKS